MRVSREFFCAHILRNGAYGIVMKGVQKCTCAGASLRSKNYAPLHCIILDTATDAAMGSGSLLLNAKKYSNKPDFIRYFGQELSTTTYNLARMNMELKRTSVFLPYQNRISTTK